MTDNKQSPYIVPGAVVLAGAIIAAAVLLAQNIPPRITAPSQEQARAGLGQEALTPRDVQIELEGWPTMGNPDAKVVMVEYSDFVCPFCKRHYDQTMPLIKQQYIDTGKVRFVYKDFVVVGGDRAAEAAHCAGEQGKFWQYHDLLFARQAEDRGRWSDSLVHRAYAVELGLNADALVQCFEERRYQQKVLASTQEAQRNGGTGTPYTLVNNIPVSGARPFSVFQAAIEAALNQ